MSLDLTPGAGSLLGEYCWELISLSRGGSLTRNTGASPSAARESSLSQILQDNPPKRYYLSQRACLGILRRADERGKALPQNLEQALLMQVGFLPVSLQQKKLTASGFCAGASPTAGGIGFQEECAPTLKAADSGTNMVPSILCLNDQGGKRMDWQEDLSGTLRAQEHGHTPILFANHGKDSRYSGPAPTAPTITARYGTGGNNTPLVEQAPILFSRMRTDRFQEGNICSTESRRQYKSAWDLICQERKELNTDFDLTPAAYLLRKLTPLECERLQGFPDGWTDIPGASDAARYKALGNSVAIPCVEYVLEGIAKVLREGQ